MVDLYLTIRFVAQCGVCVAARACRPRAGSVSSSTRASPGAPETRRELARASGDDRMREEEKRTVRAVEIACLISCERVNGGENREVKWAYVVVWRDVRSKGIPP